MCKFRDTAKKDKQGLSQDNFSYFSINRYILCDPFLELSEGDGSNEASQMYVFIEKKEKLSVNYLYYPFLSEAL